MDREMSISEMLQRHPIRPAMERVISGDPMMKFLFLYRDSPDPRDQPSPTEMQAGYMQWKAWMAKHAKEILEQPPPRSGPKPGGASAVYKAKAGAVTDGPYAEGKEIVGGWSFIEAESFERAVEIAKEVPMFSSVEIREITTF
jgi:hypothetical protein